jgi:hypothetical protein
MAVALVAFAGLAAFAFATRAREARAASERP